MQWDTFSALQSICFVLCIHRIVQAVFHKHRSNVCAQLLAVYYSNVRFLNLGSRVFIKARMAVDHYSEPRLNEHEVWAELYGIIEWACVFDWRSGLLRLPQIWTQNWNSIWESIGLLFIVASWLETYCARFISGMKTGQFCCSLFSKANSRVHIGCGCLWDCW